MSKVNYEIKQNGDITVSYENIDNGYCKLATINGNNFMGFGSLNKWIEDRNDSMEHPYPDPLEGNVLEGFKTEYIKITVQPLKRYLHE
jgi:hypothetical protein